MDTKTCRICGETKPLLEFHQRKTSKDGHHSACKPCAIAEQNRSKMKQHGFWGLIRTDEAFVPGKQCVQCRTMKPASDFVKNKRFADGYNHICKQCLYARRQVYGGTPAGKAVIAAGMKRRYWRDPEAKRDDKTERAHGLPRYARAALLELQGGVCAICSKERSDGGRRLAIDHDHTTGAIRGILCMWCNQAIGQLQENPALLRKAADYLENPPAAHLYLTSVFVRKSGQ